MGFGSRTGLLKIDVQSRDVRQALSRIEEDRAASQFLQEFGAFLFDRLLSGHLATTYELNRKHAETNDPEGGLCVALEILAEELRHLPWELMYHPVDREWLCTSPANPLVRYVDEVPQSALSVSPPLRVLICVAEPSDLPAASAHVEVQAVEDALSRLASERVLSVTRLEHARRATLSQKIDEVKPHVFHFVGHGDERGTVSGLALEDRDGRAEFVPAGLLREMLHRPGSVRVAVLTACRSDGIAFDLAREGIASVGTRYPIRTEAAVHFCRSLYESLASSGPLDAAVNAARFGVRLECDPERKDWFTPVVYLARGVANLFDIRKLVRIIRVQSKPPGGRLYLDGADSGKVTPETVVFEDSAPHSVSVRLPGYVNSPVQQIPAAHKAKPLRLDFIMRAESAQVRVRTNRPGATIFLTSTAGGARQDLGVTRADGTLGPVAAPPGTYRMAGWVPGEQGPPTSGGVVRITGRGLTELTLTFPEKPPSALTTGLGRVRTWVQESRANLKKAAIIVGASVLLLAVLVVALVSRGEPGTSNVVENDTNGGADSAGMVTVPAGQLIKGSTDESVTARLLLKYGLKSARKEALETMLMTAPRRVNLRSFYIDRHEVTNAEYRNFLEAVARTGDASYRHPQQPSGKDHTPQYWSNARYNQDTQPVVGVDSYDAYAYAKWAGKRLPTEDEWELAARGTDGRPYPWGSTYSESRFRLGRRILSGPLPVTLFTPPRPGAPVGMAGNVSEWTASTSVHRGRQVTVAKGGAWCDRPGEIVAVTFVRWYGTHGARRQDFGFRCARDASGGAAPADMILIRGGIVTLGGEDTLTLRLMRTYRGNFPGQAVAEAFLGKGRETVYVPAFRIDRCEVTNAEYRKFLEEVARTGDASCRHPDQPSGKDHTPKYWSEAQFNRPEQPVVGVDWFDAYAYAKWAKKRLPTRDEWGRAARGDSGRLYPWGDTYSTTRCVGLERRLKAPEAADGCPQGASPYGVLRMAGNVMEWTDDNGDEGSTAKKMLRGAGWTCNGDIFGLTYFRMRDRSREYRGNHVGFRCVASPGGAK